jgi:cytochrome c peroxidase
MRALMMLAVGGAVLVAAAARGPEWQAEEIALLESLHLEGLEPLRPDPTNRYADDPRAAALGHRLFFDARLSANGEVSCGTCHLPELDFQDGKPLGEGVGVTDRRTMPVASTAHSAWMFWDGRKDSQWSQALGPLESPVEHGGTRAQYAHLVAAEYGAEYEAIFGPLPDLSGVPAHAGPVQDATARTAWDALPPERQDAVNRVFANVGKAIAAYERTIEHGPSRFDRWVAGLAATGRAPEGVLTSDEVAGARLFVGGAGCVTCHNGPLFTDDYFHNTGVPGREGAPVDLGRSVGAQAVMDDPFNCRGPYSDAAPGTCRELEFMVLDSHEMVRAFKTPSLRNVAGRAPYMHAGQIATLEDVVRHYRRAPRSPAGHSELRPLKLSDREVDQIVAFLRTLSGPLVAPPASLEAPKVGS